MTSFLHLPAHTHTHTLCLNVSRYHFLNVVGGWMKFHSTFHMLYSQPHTQCENVEIKSIRFICLFHLQHILRLNGTKEKENFLMAFSSFFYSFLLSTASYTALLFIAIKVNFLPSSTCCAFFLLWTRGCNNLYKFLLFNLPSLTTSWEVGFYSVREKKEEEKKISLKIWMHQSYFIQKNKKKERIHVVSFI